MIKKTLKVISIILGGGLVCLIADDILIVRVGDRRLEPDIIEAIENYHVKLNRADVQVQGKYFFAVDYYGLKNNIEFGKKEIYLWLYAQELILEDDSIVKGRGSADLMVVYMKKIDGLFQVVDIRIPSECDMHHKDKNRMFPPKIRNKMQLSAIEEKMLIDKLEDKLYEQAENFYFE